MKALVPTVLQIPPVSAILARASALLGSRVLFLPLSEDRGFIHRTLGLLKPRFCKLSNFMTVRPCCFGSFSRRLVSLTASRLGFFVGALCR